MRRQATFDFLQVTYALVEERRVGEVARPDGVRRAAPARSGEKQQFRSRHLADDAIAHPLATTQAPLRLPERRLARASLVAVARAGARYRRRLRTS